MIPELSKFRYGVHRRLIKAFQPIKRRMAVMEEKVNIWKGIYEYDPRPEDIFVVSYPKSGTTLMQMIIHQLLSDGDMEQVPHISCVHAEIESHKQNIIPPLAQMQNPRVIKTHIPYSQVPKGPGRYIYVMRNGLDVAVSYYYHHMALKGYRAPMDHFFPMWLKGEVAFGTWFDHVDEWLNAEKAGDLNIMVVKFEDILDDLESQVRRVAEFIGVGIDESQMPRILENCSFKHMKKYEERFDIANAILLNNGIIPGHFIREGKAKNWQKELAPVYEKEYKERYKAQIQKHGIERYDQLLEELRLDEKGEPLPQPEAHPEQHAAKAS